MESRIPDGFGGLSSPLPGIQGISYAGNLKLYFFAVRYVTISPAAFLVVAPV